MATRLNNQPRPFHHQPVRLQQSSPLIGNKVWAILILTTLWLTPQGRKFGEVTAEVLKDIAAIGYKEGVNYLKENPYFQSFFSQNSKNPSSEQ